MAARYRVLSARHTSLTLYPGRRSPRRNALRSLCRVGLPWAGISRAVGPNDLETSSLRDSAPSFCQCPAEGPELRPWRCCVVFPRPKGRCYSEKQKQQQKQIPCGNDKPEKQKQKHLQDGGRTDDCYTSCSTVPHRRYVSSAKANGPRAEREGRLLKQG